MMVEESRSKGPRKELSRRFILWMELLVPSEERRGKVRNSKIRKINQGHGPISFLPFYPFLSGPSRRI